MTKDEILNMPAGREMDVLISENLMNFVNGRQENHSPNGYTWWTTHIPHYSTDIDDTWELVEKFYSMGLNKYSNGAEWRCYLVRSKDGKEQDGVGVANTAALAICRAALITVLELETK